MAARDEPAPDPMAAALQAIVAAVEPGGSFLSDAPLSGGVSYKLRALELRDSSGRPGKLVLREATDLRAGRWGLPLAAEFALIAQLHEQGALVPTPRLFDDSGTILRHPYAVYNFAPGEPLLGSEAPAAVGIAFAQELAKVHDVPIDALDLGALPDWTGFASGVLADSPRVPDTALREDLIRQKLTDHWPPPPARRRCLLHGDFWPGNVIWDEGRITAILDWENAAIGDPAADVAISRLDLLWSFGSTATIAFTRRYREITSDPLPNLAIWDLFSALRPAGDLQNWADEYPKLGRPDITHATMTASHRWFLSQALAALG